jgi:hypothetical protein
MTRPSIARILPCLLAFLAAGCGSGPPVKGLEVDGGHTELLSGVWLKDSHTLSLRSDSTFQECLARRLPPASTITREYCVQGRYTVGTPDFAFRPAICAREDSLIDCAGLDRALGDSAAPADSLLVTLRHKDRRFDADVIIERDCDAWEPGLFGEECVRLGGDATGRLELTLSAEGAPPRNAFISFSREVSPDSLK